MLLFQIDGIPTPWTPYRQNKGRTYNPKHVHKQQAIWQLAPQFNQEPLTCPIRLDVNFYMPIPKATSKIRRKQMLAGLIHHIGKPDRSNLLKFIEDCLEGAGILSNDSIIVSGDAVKIYGDKPKTIIRIELLANMEKYSAT